MRIFEFAGDDNLDKFIVVLKNFVGRYSSKGQSAKLNWQALDKIARSSGIELMTDYETFKSMYDSSPQLQTIVKNFNADGLELNVPGAKDEQPKGDGTAQPQDSQAAVDKIAASAAPQQLAAQA
jgi:DNA-binding phage protein